MALPMMLVVAVFSYLPMGGLIVAFKNYSYRDGILKSPFCDPLWKNFEFLLKSPDTSASSAIRFCTTWHLLY